MSIFVWSEGTQLEIHMQGMHSLCEESVNYTQFQ